MQLHIIINWYALLYAPLNVVRDKQTKFKVRAIGNDIYGSEQSSRFCMTMT